MKKPNSVDIQKAISKDINNSIESMALHFNDCYVLVKVDRLRRYLYTTANNWYEKGLESKPKKINKRVKK